MDVSLALSGHRFTVIAIDGNPVPRPASVEVLKLDVAERADVIVEMNSPGVWVFGSTDDEDRNMGMGVVIEYENHQGEPQWIKPAKNDWAYASFAATAPVKAPDETIKLTFEKVPGGRGGRAPAPPATNLARGSKDKGAHHVPEPQQRSFSDRH